MHIFAGVACKYDQLFLLEHGCTERKKVDDVELGSHL